MVLGPDQSAGASGSRAQWILILAKFALSRSRLPRKTLYCLHPLHRPPTPAPPPLSRRSRWKATCPETGPRGSDRGAALAQSSRELKDPQHELRDLHALRAVLVLGSARAGGVMLFGGGLQELAGDARALDAGGVSGPEHGGKVQRVGAACEGFLELPAPAPPSATHQHQRPRASAPAEVVTKHRKHPHKNHRSLIPTGVSRACWNTQPPAQPQRPRLFTALKGRAAVRVTSLAIASARG